MVSGHEETQETVVSYVSEEESCGRNAAKRSHEIKFKSSLLDLPTEVHW